MEKNGNTTTEALKNGINEYEKENAITKIRRRSAIEPVNMHIKTDNRLSQNFLNGIISDI